MKTTILLAVLAAALLLACAPESELPLDEAELGLAPAPAQSCAGNNKEGKPCNDGFFCTVDDTCHSGVCVGEERPCANAVGFCSIGVCDEATDSCESEPREDGCVDKCDAPQTQKAYRVGWKLGFEAVSKAWDRRGENCNKTEAFVDKVTTRVAKAQQLADSDGNVKLKRRCRKAGIADGAYAALEVVQSTCDTICWLDGELVGKVSAASYCEMAMTADGPLDVPEWLRGPLNMCGLNYEFACDSTFIDVTGAYKSQTGVCEPVTEGAFAAAWDASRESSCAYDNQP